MVKKPYPVPDRMIYYDYWIKFLNQLKKILSLDDLYEMEADLMKLVQCIDFDYCRQYKTDGVHKTWCYEWKSKVFCILALLVKVQRTNHHKKDYFHEEIMKDWEMKLKDTQESIDINLSILNGEKLGAEREKNESKM